MRRCFAALIVLADCVASSGTAALPGARAAVARIRIVVTTESPAATLSFDRGTIVDAVIASTDPDARARAGGQELSLTRSGHGLARTSFRLLASGFESGSVLRWRLRVPSASPTQIEIYNENDRSRALLVDRFDVDGTDNAFESRIDLLLTGGPVTIDAGPAPLVLAFEYPWYLYSTWTTSGRLRDRPMSLYSNENPEEVAHSLADAHAAGLDGVIVSWVGNMTWSDRRLRIVLDQAQALGLKVSILVETLEAIDVLPDGTSGPSPDKVRRWLEKAVDTFSSHPGFLNVHGQPVIFVYAVDAFTHDDWTTIAASLAETSRHVHLLADATDPSFLDSFAGAFTYATATTPLDQLRQSEANQVRTTQSYNLLHDGARRIAAGTVSPGYDDRLLDRDHPTMVDRADGAFYDAQWATALAARPDWILVTSWNEFYENTHIEPSVLYGHIYQMRTLLWSSRFHSAAGHDPRQAAKARRK